MQNQPTGSIQADQVTCFFERPEEIQNDPASESGVFHIYI